MKDVMRKITPKRIFKILSLTITVILLLLLVFLALLPPILSSRLVQTRIQQTLSSSMKRQVTWSGFSFGWSEGLKLSGLKFGDGPAPLLKTDVGQLVIVPSFGRGMDGRFGVDLLIRIKYVRAELAPGPPKSPSPPSGKDPLTMVAEMIQKVQGLDFPLPVDVQVLLEVSPVQVVYHASAKELRLQDFSFRFAMPSLAAKPLLAEVHGQIFVDGSDLGKVSLDAKVSNLVTKAERIHPASALFAVETAAPGTALTISGGLSQAGGFAARLKLDLPALLAVAEPFIPSKTPKPTGNIEALLTAKTDAKRDLQATVTVSGTGLAARGGSLEVKRVGPLDLKLQQQIATDHVNQRVAFPGGSFAIPGLVDAVWSASVDNPTVPERKVEVAFGPLRLDLARALSLTAPFLPANKQLKELVGEAFLRSPYSEIWRFRQRSAYRCRFGGKAAEGGAGSKKRGAAG